MNADNLRFESFDELFREATGNAPYPYQQRLAMSVSFPELIAIPTGMGKTAATVLGWLWRRRFADQTVRAETPRRLVYCLPMRVLVEQTIANARAWIDALGLLADQRPVGVFQLMGGDAELNWDRHPEQDCILVGTQDMLLSRALNRGYAMSQFRWPMEFGLLNSDCQWIMDEVQLMGSGLPTTTQLQAFRELLGTMGPTKSVWMSATLSKDWLRTPDFESNVDHLTTLALDDDDRQTASARDRLEASKPTSQLDLEVSVKDKKYGRLLGEKIVEFHRPRTLSLAIVNTVDRALVLYDILRKLKPAAELLLIHSRFRGSERCKHREMLEADIPEGGRIIVSTQVVEAGLDLDARVLFTEIAPWPSMVQRFGRCNRTGRQEEPAIYWVDVEDKLAPPYDAGELCQSRRTLEKVVDAGLESLPPVDLPWKVGSVLRHRDLMELFDITPDLAGTDIDISCFIRDEDPSSRSVQVFWREDLDKPDENLPRPRRDELCPVPISSFRKWLEKHRAWQWDHLESRWDLTNHRTLQPGLMLLVDAEQGGYDLSRGWSERSKKRVPIFETATGSGNEGIADDHSSEKNWQTIEEHTRQVTEKLDEVLGQLALPPDVDHSIREAAMWHDIGKGHEVFQKTMLGDPPENDVDVLWAKTVRRGVRHCRKKFRHELASALALVQNDVDDLICYLVAAHHGRVRVAIRSFPDEMIPEEQGQQQPDRRFALGIWDEDPLPAVRVSPEHEIPETVLDLSIMEIGDGPLGMSWASRVFEMLYAPHLGPFRLAYMEALLRAADQLGSEVKS